MTSVLVLKRVAKVLIISHYSAVHSNHFTFPLTSRLEHRTGNMFLFMEETHVCRQIWFGLIFE